MIEVIPAVLAENFQELSEKIAKYASGVSVIQIDICDGNFVPSISWPMQANDENCLRTI